VERKDYETAVKIADTIDWERVRNIKMLSTVSLAYEKVSRFEEAKDLLLMAYECAPVGRRFLYKLTELAVKQGEFDEAEAYLKEFAATSPQDPSRLLLRYEISKAKGEPTERLITILEAYQKREFEERWSYELANLYYRVGKNEECVKLCDEIVLWFGVGTYVDKAMELKQRIAPLTPDQIEKRENKEKYLRRLEEVQKEFEDRYRVLEEPTKEAVEAVVAQTAQEQEAEAASEISVEEIVEEIAEDTAEEIAGEIAENTAEEIAVELSEDILEEIAEETPVVSTVEEPAEAEAIQRLQEEVESSLAREIEAAALTAALNEAMLRETAATMGTMEMVENDHSQEQERTKVAVVRVSMQDKTREFVREARVINVILEETPDRQVTAEEVEAKLQEEEPIINKEELVQEEIPVEEPVAEPTVEPEPEVVVEPVVEAEPEPVEEAPIQEDIPVEEPVAEPTVEPEPEVVVEPVAEAAPESVEEEPVQEEISAAEPTVRDHYVLVACANEAEGVKECLAYIRRMRELMGYPVTQVAKIQGVKLATKDMAQTLRKLQGRDLVVVGIADLPDALLCQTVELMAADAIESFIALIGTEEEIAGLQSRQAFFAGCRVLTYGVEMPVLQMPASAPEEVSEKVKGDTPVVVPEETPVEAAEEEISLEAEQSMLAKLVEDALHASLFATEEPAAEEPAVEEEPVQEVPETALEESETNPVVWKQEEPAQQSMQAKGAAKELTPKAFYECAVQYAHMMDAKVDEMGGLAIYAAAEEYQQERESLTEELAQELVENAIQKAERRTLKSLFSNRYDKEGFLILKEQHFKD